MHADAGAGVKNRWSVSHRERDVTVMNAHTDDHLSGLGFDPLDVQ